MFWCWPGCQNQDRPGCTGIAASGLRSSKKPLEALYVARVGGIGPKGPLNSQTQQYTRELKPEPASNIVMDRSDGRQVV